MATKTTRYILRVQAKDGTLYIHLPKDLVSLWNLNKGDYVELIFDDKVATLKKI